MKERRKRQFNPYVPWVLKNTKGESIAEVLVAVLIAALAMLLAATLIVNGTRMVKRSASGMAKAYDSISQLEQGSVSGEGSSAEITIQDDNTNQTLESGEVRVIQSGKGLSRYTAETNGPTANGTGGQTGSASGGSGTSGRN